MRPCQQCPPRCSCQPTSPAAALLAIVVSCSSAGLVLLPKSPPPASGGSGALGPDTLPQDLLAADGEGSLPHSRRTLCQDSDVGMASSRKSSAVHLYSGSAWLRLRPLPQADSRRTSRGVTTVRRGGSPPSMALTRCRAASRPMRSMSRSTEVRGGRDDSAITVQLSKPTTATSSVTRRPLSRSVSSTPRAIWSLPQKTASTSGAASNSCSVAARPYVAGLSSGAVKG